MTFFLVQGVVLLAVGLFYAAREGGAGVVAFVLIAATGAFSIGMVLATHMKRAAVSRYVGGVQRRPSKDPQVLAEEHAIAELHQATADMPDGTLYLDRETLRAIAILRADNVVCMVVTEVTGDLQGLARVYPLGTHTTPRKAPLIYQVRDKDVPLPPIEENPWSPRNPGAMVLSLDEVGELLKMVRRAQPV